MVHNIFNTLLNSVCKYFVEDFCISVHEGYFLLSSLVAQLVKNLPAVFDPWVGKIPWRMKWQPTPVFLLGKSRGQRGLVG